MYGFTATLKDGSITLWKEQGETVRLEFSIAESRLSYESKDYDASHRNLTLSKEEIEKLCTILPRSPESEKEAQLLADLYQIIGYLSARLDAPELTLVLDKISATLLGRPISSVELLPFSIKSLEND